MKETKHGKEKRVRKGRERAKNEEVGQKEKGRERRMIKETVITNRGKEGKEEEEEEKEERGEKEEKEQRASVT